jgi:hypothetical protein
LGSSNDTGDGDWGPPLKNLAVEISDNVLFQQIDQEMVLLDLESGEYYGLNEVGARIWTLLLEGKSLAQVLDTMVEEFEVTPEHLRGDIQRFLILMRDRGLIELVPRPQD